MRMGSRSRLACLLLALAIPFLAGCNDDDDETLGDGFDFGSNDPNKMTAIGDSITAGGWPLILASMIGRSVVNRGVGGTTSGDGVGSAGRALESDRPGYLLVQYGANDAVHNIDEQVVAANIRAIILAAKANQTIPVVATVAPMYDNHGIFAGNARAISDAIRSVCGQEDVAVADVEEAFGSDRSLIGEDGLHPTDAGQQEIAAVFFDVLN